MVITLPAEEATFHNSGFVDPDGWLLTTEGSMAVTADVPEEGEYSVKAWAASRRTDAVPVAVLLVDDVNVGSFDVLADVSDGVYSEIGVTVVLTPGNHTIGVRYDNGPPVVFGGPKDGLLVSVVEVTGPLDAVPEINRTREAILTCDPGNASVSECAEEVIAAFGLRAWRRPLSADELATFVTFIEGVVDDGNAFDLGVELVVRAMLGSPNFLFQIETDDEPDSQAAHTLSDFEVASRLSYFIWSSMPDQELFDLAVAGELQDPDVLEAQARRMVADPKAWSITENFAGQWLYIRAVETVEPDPIYYPDWGPDLQSAAKGEMELFFEDFVDGDISMKELLTAESGPVNWRLAEHYGTEVRFFGEDYWNAHLEPIGRGGWLTTTGLLTATSYPTRTSPVQRGKWVLTQLLCDEPPPPPPGVEGLIDEEEADATTIREQLEAHRADPACAACHETMDELGFGLEHFDGIGAFRDEDGGELIDATGILPDGRNFYGARELAEVVADDPAYAECITQQMFTYALGRAPKSGDDRTYLEQINGGFVAGDMQLKELIVAIVRSDPFRMRRGNEGGE